MEVPEGFAEQVRALSSSTPREAIENLLKALLPRVPVTTRNPLPAQTMTATGQPEPYAVGDGVASSAPHPFTKVKRGTRTRGADYRVLMIVRHSNPYKYGSKAWRTYRLFLYNDGKTIAAIKRAANISPQDYDLGYLHYASRDGYIKLT